MNFSFGFLDIRITHLAQLPMIKITLKWHHINICNKIVNFFGCPKCFLVHDYDRTCLLSYVFTLKYMCRFGMN
jgi:hypothetical protein